MSDGNQTPTPPTAGVELIPRLYQQEIFDRAVKGNVICAMDTGSGKTQIAVMLLKHIMSLLPVGSNPKKVAIFLVASVPLAEQQGDFLQSQLGLKVKKYYGALGVDYWDRERWAVEFAEADVMVMTAQVFFDLLNHAHWSIDKVALLIFDEAHHCNKNHPYAQIMKTHYNHCEPEKRPHIFGMTASPIFNIRNPTQSLANLQDTLHAKVLAVRDNALELALNAPKPREFLAEYPPPPGNYPSYPIPGMWTVLEEFKNLVFPEPDDERELKSRFEHVHGELGPLAADYFVLLFIKRTMIKNTVSSADLGAYYSDDRFVTPKAAEGAPQGRSWSELDDAYNYHLERIQALATGLNDELVTSWFTPKLQLLIQVLLANRTEDFSAIIFVEQRQIATTLSWLLPMVPQLRGWIEAAALVGHGGTGGPSFEGNGMAHSTQRAIVRDFRSGDVNLVIATSVAEEGLDFQACKLVVRLDAPQTMVGYLQSRGRARKHDSSYVVLTDPAGSKRYRGFRDAEPHLRLVYQRINEEEEANQVDESILMDEDEEDDGERYVVQSTGAVATPSTAISLLHLWCSLLEVDRFTKPPAPDFHISGSYMCTITVPPSILNPSLCGPVRGPLRRTRDGARRSAAFLFVKKLHQLELFDDYLMPYKKSGPNLDLSQSLNGILQREGELFETTSPWGDIWQPGSPMWMNAISLGDSFPIIALITGKEQPARDLVIYKGGAADHIKIHSGRRLEFASEEERMSQLELMQRFSNCAIYWAITSRKLPLRATCLVVPLTGTNNQIDHERMAYVTAQATTGSAVKLPKEDWLKPEMRGSHVMEAHRLGSNSYMLLGLQPEIRLSSTPVVPEGETACREAKHESYRSYWEEVTHIVKRGVTLDIPEDDCWLELVSIEKTQFRSHDGLFGLVNLPGPEGSPPRPRRIFVPSSMARVSPIPAEIIRICTYFPNILGQITVLSRMELANDTLQTHGVPFNLLLEALTLPAVQAGFDYQRLETIGDSVLKVSMCTHLFLKHPGHHEGQLSSIKDSVVSNANLMKIGRQSPLSRFLITERTQTRRTWTPPKSSTEEAPDTEEDSDKQNGEMEVNDTAQKVTFHTKSLADCTESTLGAAYISLGIEAALRAGKALCLPLGGTTPWHRRPKPSVVERGEMTVLFAPVEEKMGYKFNNPSLVVEAFTHTAYDLSKGPSYNRLEFLGDCLFDLYVVLYMFQKFEKMTPGQMSWARSRLVNATTFGKLAVGLGLHKHVLTTSANLQKAMTSFAAEIEEISLGEILHSCWKIDAPKAISDVFEAIFGAIYVDSNFNLELTFGHIDQVMHGIMEFVSPDMPGDPTSELVRWVAGQGCEAQGSTIFRSSASSKNRMGAHDTVETNLHGRTIARETRPTSKIARPIVAEITLRILKDEKHELALSKICSCPRAVLKRKEAPTAIVID